MDEKDVYNFFFQDKLLKSLLFHFLLRKFAKPPNEPNIVRNVLRNCLFVYSHMSNFSAIWWLSPLAVIRPANLGLCWTQRAVEQGGNFIVPHLLRHGTSVYTVSSERPAPTYYSGIRTPDTRIIRSLRPTL
jgi:hypothetical protein